LGSADSGPGWLLAGKLAPPEQRITVASRDALLARLDASLSRCLSVIVSPPGFGKTTLLTQWWRTLETRSDLYAGWLTLDEIDSEVSRFMAGMILAVARAGVDVGPLEVSARQLSIDPNVRPIALALLEAIRRSGRRTVLILDDFHRARSASSGRVEGLLGAHHGDDRLSGGTDRRGSAGGVAGVLVGDRHSGAFRRVARRRGAQAQRQRGAVGAVAALRCIAHPLGRRARVVSLSSFVCRLSVSAPAAQLRPPAHPAAPACGAGARGGGPEAVQHGFDRLARFFDEQALAPEFPVQPMPLRSVRRWNPASGNRLRNNSG